MSDSRFAEEFGSACTEVHATAKGKGWWDRCGTMTDVMVTKIALIHCECSEAVEALRNHDPQSKKCEGFRQADEEIMDVIIRSMDLLGGRDVDAGALFAAKMKFNEGRTWRHGGKLF